MQSHPTLTPKCGSLLQWKPSFGWYCCTFYEKYTLISKFWKNWRDKKYLWNWILCHLYLHEQENSEKMDSIECYTMKIRIQLRNILLTGSMCKKCFLLSLFAHRWRFGVRFISDHVRVCVCSLVCCTQYSFCLRRWWNTAYSMRTNNCHRGCQTTRYSFIEWVKWNKLENVHIRLNITVTIG